MEKFWGDRMDWTPEKAYRKLQDIYTDEIMQQEKRRVFQQVYRHLREHMEDLAISNGLKPKAEKQLSLFKEYTFMPGNNLFQSMRYVFLLARGEKEYDRGETQRHLQRIYRALFTSAGTKNPVIPESFWDTPLGVACVVAEKGVEAVYPILDKIDAEE